MATDTATKQTDTKPAEAPKAASHAASTQAKATSKPRATTAKKPRATTAKKPRAKTAAKTRRTRSTAASSSRSRTASKSRTRKPAARTTRTEAATATATAPRTQAKALNGGREIVAGVIDAQERTVTAIVGYQTRAAELSQIPGATAIAGAQAQLLRGATDAYVSAARALLK